MGKLEMDRQTGVGSRSASTENLVRNQCEWLCESFKITM